MSRTYSRGHYKRTDHKHGHCFYCGWDPKFSWARKTQKNKLMQFDIIPYLFIEFPELF